MLAWKIRLPVGGVDVLVGRLAGGEHPGELARRGVDDVDGVRPGGHGARDDEPLAVR